MIRLRHGWLFPLVLAVCLGGLSAWLGRISQIDVEEAALNPNEPQYSMTGINGKRFDGQGRLKESLSAETAWQLPKSSNITFEKPELALYDGGRLLYTVKSNEAGYHTESRKVQFQNEVVLTKNADAQRPAGILKTNSLTVDTQTETAETQEAVEYQYGDSHGTANGLVYDHKQGFLNLPSRVKAIIYDPKNL
ncbi:MULTISPECIES: LPS export ABC transporter periplasmic protein LptC [Neisseria]|uniref:Lipopolysaccharide-assembly LptC-related family protein n=1 Tax=Neisseria musculi TaxID=1815583 RepID=A0A7H1MFB5_9NEIS|nr:MULTISPECIES: LPS export ABC transporter periplasmic protein LptC [Neisseria]MBF0803841.1 LPS export ABC transporter periplasmic protein LptC [Neisseria sp. 19428wB4_WF04]QNT60330.1 lipopolysaccharide-assembly, LptC-related family protein [Neisseria musculi]TFU43437.1 LPS export ABC transporter periplasmic protein LptC [Neisseria sp. WF04]